MSTQTGESGESWWQYATTLPLPKWLRRRWPAQLGDACGHRIIGDDSGAECADDLAERARHAAKLEGGVPMRRRVIPGEWEEL